ncbi:CFI-box-CTERM domain-containing protein [Actinotalea sp. K2]|uniref:CFI-box-CTERM domain-containing protein n=1 Tax=Actinotalea sp. K2 TaxID=2939438 RepID=UPI002017DC4F|nr:CFI-box-CTERM domain-containing protein [Actinotalea sp. K2]MCL3862965.1 hypothetical protein [Actinotalea sp. K2]
MVSKFSAHVADRLAAGPGPIKFDHASQRDWLWTSEVLAGLLLGAIPPEEMDRILKGVEAGERSGDPRAIRQMRILNYSMAGDTPAFAAMMSMTSPLAKEAAYGEIPDLIADSQMVIKNLWASADSERRVELVEMLTMKCVEGSKLAGALLTLSRPELWSDSGLWNQLRASPMAPVTQAVLPPSGVLPGVDSRSLDSFPATKIPALLEEFISELPSLRSSSDSYPTEWEDAVREAVHLKRSGDYEASVAAYVRLAREAGTAHLQILRGLFKSTASAGYLAHALRLGVAGKSAFSSFDREAMGRWAASGLQDPDAGREVMQSLSYDKFSQQEAIDDDINDLLIATSLPTRLATHLAMISGNVTHFASREYDTMLEELGAVVAQHAAALDADVVAKFRENRNTLEGLRSATTVALAQMLGSHAPTPAGGAAVQRGPGRTPHAAAARPVRRPPASPAPQKGGGCYIATAVYGSYDAPPVLTLRRFRDERLLTHAPGRVITRVYYAVSPVLSTHFSQGKPLSRQAKKVLDRIVRRLERSR